MIASLLLSAGASRRMGRPKLTLDLAGHSVVERALDVLLASPVDLVLAVVPPAGLQPLASRSEPRLQRVVNREPEKGMASSIRAGLAALPAEARAVLIALADKPLVRPETVARVINRFKQGGADIVYPTFRGQQGHPVLFAAAFFGQLGRLKGDSGAKPLLEKYGERSVAIEVDDPGVLLDIDTPEDYAKVLKTLKERAPR